MLFRAGFGSPQPSPGGNVQKRLATPRNVAKPFWGCNLLPPLMPKWQGPPTGSYECAVPHEWRFFGDFFVGKVGRSFTTSKWHADDPQKIKQLPKSIWLWSLPENHRKKCEKIMPNWSMPQAYVQRAWQKDPHIGHWNASVPKRSHRWWLYFQCIYKLSEMCSIVTVKLIHYLHLR